jgi:hypothetical protein
MLKGNMKYFGALVWSHASYIFITAVWPLIDIESFMAVTGPKTDIWLVKTVGALLIPVALTMAAHTMIDSDKRPLATLAGCTAVAFISIDVYYALNDTISDVYLADAAIELIFLIGWMFYGRRIFITDLKKL